METIGSLIKTALVQHKQADDVLAQLTTVLDTHLPGFSTVYADQLAQTLTSMQAVLDIKSLARNHLYTQQTRLQAFCQDVHRAGQFVGMADHAFAYFNALYARLQQDSDAIYDARNAIRHQIELANAFIGLQAGATQSALAPHKKITIPLVPKKSTQRKSTQPHTASNKETYQTSALIARMQALGLQISQTTVIKKFDKLPDAEKRKLAQYLTTVENYAGSFRTSPYVTSLKSIPYLALKFSYGTSAYRIICHKDTHEITDICEHDTYTKNYLIS